MFEAGDLPAGTIGHTWSTSKAKRGLGNHPALARRHMAKQYGNFQSSPRPGDREPIEKLALGYPSTPAPGRSQVVMMHRSAGKSPSGQSFRPNTSKHNADIHVTAERGQRAPALRGAPRTAAVSSGRGSNPVRLASHLGGRGR